MLRYNLTIRKYLDLGVRAVGRDGGYAKDGYGTYLTLSNAIITVQRMKRYAAMSPLS